ncbi:MAG: hypothetical protein ACK2UH_11670 [Candidatus Promineifilaceae bacterium]
MLVTFLLAMLISGCGQAATEDTSSAPSEVRARPTIARPEPDTSLAAKSPDASTLPSFVKLELTGSGDAMSSTQYPAYLMAELSGRELSSVSAFGGSVLEDGRRRVFFHQPVDPDPQDDDWPGEWADGIYDLEKTWDFMGDFLWDGQRGDFVVLWASAPDAVERTVHGRYRAAGSDTFLDAVLVVNIDLGMAREVIKTATGEAVVFQAGDEFQTTVLMLDERGNLSDEPGVSLAFEEGGHMAYTRRPAPSGTYFLGISAETASGETDSIYASYQVNNDSLLAGYRAFLDVSMGFQLLYPETWPAPSERGRGLLFADPAGDVQINVSAHPEMADQPIVDLKQLALAAYGEVSILYEDQVEVGPGGGLRTVYGYQGSDGLRTGVLLTFSQQGMAYVVDVDGPANEETRLLEIAGVIAGGWRARAVVATSAGRWTEADIDGLAVEVPADHRLQRMSNGWQRFTGADELTFLALRSEPAVGQGLFHGLSPWLEVAGSDVLEFAASEIFAHERGGQSWARVDFEYSLDADQRISGAIMLTRIGQRFLIFWFEAPLAQFPAYETGVVATLVDELSRDYGGG